MMSSTTPDELPDLPITGIDSPFEMSENALVALLLQCVAV